MAKRVHLHRGQGQAAPLAAVTHEAGDADAAVVATPPFVVGDECGVDGRDQRVTRLGLGCCLGVDRALGGGQPLLALGDLGRTLRSTRVEDRDTGLDDLALRRLLSLKSRIQARRARRVSGRFDHALVVCAG